MDVMVEESDLAVVGRVNSVGQLVLNEEDQQGVWYYDATLIVEETLFGIPRQQVELRVPMYVGSELSRRIPIKAPLLEVNANVVLFLTNQSGYMEKKREGQYFLHGGGLSWGFFWIEGGQVRPYAVPGPNEPKETEGFLAWVKRAGNS